MFVGAKCRPADRQCFSTVITRIQRPCFASILPPHAPPVLGRSLSVSQAVGRAASLAYSAPLLGKPSAWLYPAAIPPHLCRGEPRQKCSGQPGGSRSGCWRRQCRNKSATDCAGASMPGSRRCRERRTAIRASEPSRLSPVRPSVHPSRPVSSAPLLRPDGLRSIPLQSPAPHDARPPPRTRSTSFRVLWHCQTLSRHPQSPRTLTRRLRDWTAP